MKNIAVYGLSLLFVLIASTAYADSDAPLGQGFFGIKIDYVDFIKEDLFNDTDADTGIYYGLEGYRKVTNATHFYLGGEVGYANLDGSEMDLTLGKLESEYKFLPVEMNAKWVFGDQLNLAIGCGLSLNFADLQTSVNDVEIIDNDEWLFGWQFLMDINYTMDNLYFGINFKYKSTEEHNLMPEDVSYRNYHAGVHGGMTF